VKYIGMPMGMWVLFGKSFEQNLCTDFGLNSETAKAVRKRAKSRYKEIIAGAPEFEKADRFKMNLVNCALLCAFVLNMPERPDVGRLTEYYADSMMTSPMKWFCRMSGKNKFTDKDISPLRATENFEPPIGIPIRGIWNFILTLTAADMRLVLLPAVSVR